MNWRRVIYIALVVFVAALIFRNISDTKPEPPEALFDQQVILHDFKHLEHPAYKEGGEYQPDSIYFPSDYTGDRGDEFYLSIKNDQGITTLKYVLERTPSGQLEYKLKNRWKDVTLPADRFESYKYENDKWVSITDAEDVKR
ncbi:MAG: hypothetical protein WC109_06530 [Syntrophomonadaceae bacterium]|nr:hypothetical protein [Syntrophomonadaceae bacterium]MDD3271247.1 hypothetical protein [Syntrophomonadaceae bacterium]MDD3898533.1 hypothetical protein [Syntrophomonadaceae bacterium]MDD4562322.1 hypothetical protein [Syntrophomonadaceae bacterium]